MYDTSASRGSSLAADGRAVLAQYGCWGSGRADRGLSTALEAAMRVAGVQASTNKTQAAGELGARLATRHHVDF